MRKPVRISALPVLSARCLNVADEVGEAVVRFSL